MKLYLTAVFFTAFGIAAKTQNVKIELSKELLPKEISTIKLYKFNSKNNCNQSKAISVVFENTVSTCFDFIKTIKAKSATKLISCLRSKKTYGGEDVACFDTDYSLVMFNNKGTIVGYVNISLFCNKLNATPIIQEREYYVKDNLRKVGFSLWGRKRLVKFLGLQDFKPYPSQQ